MSSWMTSLALCTNSVLNINYTVVYSVICSTSEARKRVSELPLVRSNSLESHFCSKITAKCDCGIFSLRIPAAILHCCQQGFLTRLYTNHIMIHITIINLYTTELYDFALRSLNYTTLPYVGQGEVIKRSLNGTFPSILPHASDGMKNAQMRPAYLPHYIFLSCKSLTVSLCNEGDSDLRHLICSMICDLQAQNEGQIPATNIAIPTEMLTVSGIHVQNHSQTCRSSQGCRDREISPQDAESSRCLLRAPRIFTGLQRAPQTCARLQELSQTCAKLQRVSQVSRRMERAPHVSTRCRESLTPP